MTFLRTPAASDTPDAVPRPIPVTSRRSLLRGATGAAAGMIAATAGALGAASGRASAQGVSDVVAPSGPGFALPPAGPEVTPFRIAIPQADIDDLKARLRRTRWPDRETVADASQGVPLAQMHALVGHWAGDYDWRRVEARLNAWPQFRTEIDGLGIHFLHVRSKHADALPIVITHGWPGSVIEFLKVIEPLTDPTAHGGRAEDAFHVVLPSLPGFGFSDKPAARGWNTTRTAHAWATLMARLGYTRWVAQGGDWGAGVTTVLGALKPAGLAGIHLNLPLVVPPNLPAQGLSPEEQRAAAQVAWFFSREGGYYLEQGTRPQTLGYGLADSPSGQAAWIYEKFQVATDNDGDVQHTLTRDELLDNISLYWFTDTGASSARMYWEHFPMSFTGPRLDLPVGVSLFKREIYKPPRSWAERAYPQLIWWNELDKGGHFAAFEQPQLFAEELRGCFANLR